MESSNPKDILPTLLGLAVLVAATSSFPQAYKWVDEDGNVHYSQTVPPEKSDRERKRLSTAGVLVEEPLYKTAPDPEETRPKSESARTEQSRAEQRDRSLRVYTSQAQLEASRDQALSRLAGEMRLVQAGYENQLDTLEGLVNYAAAQDRSGRSVSSDLQQRISEARHAARLEAEKIAMLEQRAETIRSQFRTDVRRWREIKGLDQPQEDPSAPAPGSQTADAASASEEPDSG